MKTRRPLAVIAATALTGLGLTALATPASANTTVTISGPDASNLTVSPSSTTGTSVTLVRATDASFAVASQSLSDTDGACTVSRAPLCTVPGNFGDAATFDIAPGSGGALVRLIDINNNTLATFTVTYPDAPAAGGTPAPVIQQFEKSATGTCNEAQPEGLNWGGASSGGWGESWAQWANDGQGGPVCTRTLAYNNSTGTWQVQ